MSRTIMLIPAEKHVGLTSVIIGIFHAAKIKSIDLRVFKPIMQLDSDNHLDATMNILHVKYKTFFIKPLRMSYVESLLIANQQDILMEEITTRYYENTKDAEIVLIEGLVSTHEHQFANDLNNQIACMLNAEIIFVLCLNNKFQNKWQEHIKLMYSLFGGSKNKNITGIIINKFNSPINIQNNYNTKLFKFFKNTNKNKIFLYKNSPLPILGCIPWNYDLIAIRVIDVVRYLNANIIYKGEIKTRRIKSIIFCTNNILNMFKYFYPDTLLVISLNCINLIMTICLAVINGLNIGAILIIDSDNTNKSYINNLCNSALHAGLPIFSVTTNVWQTALNLQNFFNMEIPIDDHSRIEKLQKHIAKNIDKIWIESLSKIFIKSHRLSPPVFRYQLIKLAKKANKLIVLPEGDEPRILKAASICVERSIARCILIGKIDNITHIAESHNIVLNENIKIIDPEIVCNKYIAQLVKLRKNKGINEILARKQLEDNVVLGTMMLEQGEVDGLVSGAKHTTANTIRPPLQIIKTAAGNSLVSSIFFMLLPEQVLVYGDCAINPNPNAEQLAEIAIQSADSATTFGIEPRVAMISYSTGYSGAGKDVDKVRQATQIAQQKRPNLIIDGPLQYDAAILPDVALLKAPNSLVAGKATVFIFPDLNTGNAIYKAVQHAAKLISIGPILQGMRKPVNDLSRGSSVEDIIYTIALTAVQSK